MIARLDTALACVEPTIAIVNNDIVSPAILKGFANLYVLFGEHITLSMRDLFADAEIAPGVSSPARDDVPAGAAFADVIKRGQLSGEIESLRVDL